MTQLDGIDHIVIATPDLLGTVAAIKEATGIEISVGGRHDIGTANYLSALTINGERTSTYLEVIGIPAERTEPVNPSYFGVNTTQTTHVSTFCINLGPDHAAAGLINAASQNPRELVAQSRTTPQGDVLRWTLLPPVDGQNVNLVPFAIDWGTTPHPSTTITAELELSSFLVETPRPQEVSDLYTKLALTIPVQAGVIDAPRISLTGPLGTFRA